MAKDEKQTEKKDIEPAKGGIVPGADGKPQLVIAGGDGQMRSGERGADKDTILGEVMSDMAMEVARGGAPQDGSRAGRLESPADTSIDERERSAIQKVGAALAHLDKIHAQGAIIDGLLSKVTLGLAGLDYECSPDRAGSSLAVLRAMAVAAGKPDAAEHIAAAIKALE